MTQDARLEQLHQWIHSLPDWSAATLEPASADASFRRYFRAIHTSGQVTKTAIIMDAPPDKEDTAPFVNITQRLLNAQVHAPAILAENTNDGFLLLEDLGSTPLLNELTPSRVDNLYGEAMHALLHLQTADTHDLPAYDQQRLYDEMALMPEWFLKTHLNIADHAIPSDLIEHTFQQLTAAALEQPSVFVHRDYHARNLMVIPDTPPGVIDYQDAVRGACTYDLVSLLRDCYIVWPQHYVERWADNFRKAAIEAGNIPPVDARSFLRWFDLMGLQRHIKVLGIFARLYHRDGKENYLNDLPLTLSYVLHVGAKHPETSQLVEWMLQAGIAKRIGTVSIPQ